MPIVVVPFECIGVALVEPLTPSSGRHHCILVVMDYTTRYPEAMPLRAATAKAVAQEVAVLFTRVGFPKQIITDKGMVFMGKTLKALAQMVELQMLHTTVYYPQTNGLVQRFNRMFKRMLKKFIQRGSQDWHCWIPFLLFAVRKVPQAFLG